MLHRRQRPPPERPPTKPRRNTHRAFSALAIQHSSPPSGTPVISGCPPPPRPRHYRLSGRTAERQNRSSNRAAPIAARCGRRGRFGANPKALIRGGCPAVTSPADAGETPKLSAAVRPVFNEITAITRAFCTQHLDAEYARLCDTLAAKLGRKRPSPLLRGDRRIWAAGIVYAIGRVNFLADPDQQPHLRTDELASLLAVKQATMANKGRSSWTHCASACWIPSTAGATCWTATRLCGCWRSMASSSMHAGCPKRCRSRHGSAG